VSACDAVLDALSEGEAFSPSLASHLSSCKDCQKLVEADRALVPASWPRVRMSAALREAVEHDTAPVVYRSAWRRAALPAGAIVAVLVAGVTALRGSVTPMALVSAVVLAALSLVGVALVLYRGEMGLGPRPAWRWAFVGGASALFGALGFARASADVSPAAGTNWLASDPFMGATAIDAVTNGHTTSSPYGTCASTGMIFAVVVGAGFLWSSRRTVAVQPAASGACAGVAAGLAAAASLQLSCPGGLGHHLAAHGLPILVTALAGAFLGRRALAP
jgi:hypothetical protein